MGKVFYDFSTINFKREHDIKYNLENYFNNGDMDSLLNVYNLIQHKLRLVLIDPLYIFTESIKSKKRHFLVNRVHKLQDEGKIQNNLQDDGDTPKFNNKIFFDYARDQFVWETLGLTKYTMQELNLFTPFWESLHPIVRGEKIKITADTVKSYIFKYETTYEKYLITKFADHYWKYLQSILRKHYDHDSKVSTEIFTFSQITSKDDESFDFLDSLLYKSNHFNEIHPFNVDDEFYNLLKKILTLKQYEIFCLWLNNYNLKEISTITKTSYSAVKTHYQRSIASIKKYYLNQNECSNKIEAIC
ncbi:helix-turn-helix transcriptional regulator [Clostridium formicaceticum]|uniref:RNA polymerase factor sigma-70 n=1 Tax=Clostridium formicaceticum TaxID=1497 RepID=A0AAC9WI65_9CLOT|nr:hypothetical protein [Clostridium formicaceticum]AOY75377.1 hypothetical protein BJL90_05360 [Clostridium formicaceticum]ARE89832.1 RNA polymerase factor sigma-70 [Clostridium formicaceticum]